MDEVDFETLLKSARDREVAAVERVVTYDQGYLKLLARRQLSQRLQVRVSPSDLV